MEKLHKIQMIILRELLFQPKAKFSRLNIQGLSSDHFSYHIKTLLDAKYVTKKEGEYSLTPKGKEFANQMDTDDVTIEKQPKIAVMVVPFKIENGQKHLLIQRRTKEPFYGYQGFVTGKIRYGEKVLEAGMRELKEETGLECDQWHIKRIVHNHVILEETGEMVEDKMFFIITAINPTGKLINTISGENYWIKEEEFANLENKYYDEDNVYKYSQEKQDMEFDEGVYSISEF